MTPIDWMMSGDTGISSETIWSVLTGNRAPQRTDTPSDPADFGRCYRLLANFPGWRERMPEVAAKYPKWGPMAAAWDELTHLYEQCCDESGQYTRKSYKANEAAATTLYQRMQSLNDAGRVAAGWIEDPALPDMPAALDPERAAFEAWWCKAYHPAKLARQEHGCYLELSAGMAWDAWRAARPSRAAVGAIVNVAAALAQRRPLEPFDNMTEATHIGHRQFDRVYRQADERVRLLAVKLADAVRAL